MIPPIQPTTSTIEISPGTKHASTTKTMEAQNIDMFAPEIILKTYIDYDQHSKNKAYAYMFGWLLARNYASAKEHRLNTKDGQEVSAEKCDELIPQFESGLLTLQQRQQHAERALAVFEQREKDLTSSDNTFKLIRAVLGGEKTYQNLPVLSLSSKYIPIPNGHHRSYLMGGGHLFRHQEILKPWQTSGYLNECYIPTPVQPQDAHEPVMKGADNSRMPFFTIKAIDTEDNKEYVQVFYQSEQDCSWYTEGEKIIDCNFLINKWGKITDSTNGDSIPLLQLQQLLKNKEIPKSRLRQLYTSEELHAHEAKGDLPQFLERFDPLKYKWLLVQPSIT